METRSRTSVRHSDRRTGGHSGFSPTAILEAVDDPIVCKDLSGSVVVWNKAAEAMFGYSAEEMLGHSILRIIPEEARAEEGEILRRLRAGEKVINFETVRLTKTGRRLDVSLTISPIHNECGEIVGAAKVVRDISEQKQAQAALRSSEATMKRAFAADTVGVLFFRLDGHISDANAAFGRMSGYSRDELSALSDWGKLTAPEFMNETMVHARQLAETGKTPPYEKQMIRKDGSRWWGLFAPIRLSGSGESTKCIEYIVDISDRKANECKLAEQAWLLDVRLRQHQESENRFRSFIEATSHVIWRTNAEGEVDQPIPSWNAFTGQTEDEASGFGWMNAIHPDDRGRVTAAWRDASAAQRTYEVKYRLKVRNGEWREILARGVPISDGNGRITEYIGTCMDITDRNRAEIELRESEERFRQLGENIPQLAWMVDSTGWIFWYNKRWYEYTGTTLEQMQGWGWETVHHPDHSERVVRKWKLHLKSGEPWEDTFPLRGRDGQFRWFLSKAFPIRDASGKIVRWFGTNTDITELRSAQETLAEREGVLRTVTNEARVGLVMVDANRRYLFSNQTFCDMIGLDECNIVGREVPDVVPDLYDQIRPNLDRALHGHRTNYELRIARHPKFQDERFYDVIYEPRVHDTDSPYVIVVLTDITERKRIEQRLEKLVAERTASLKETVGELEAFSYTIAHDMRAPLRAMQSFSAILIQDYGKALDSEAQNLLGRIAKSASRLDHLIQDVLNYSKIVRADLRLEPVDTKQLIEEIIHSYPHLQSEAADISVETALPKVLGNRAALTQVFSNLLGNAVKFVPPGVRPQVTIRAELTAPSYKSPQENSHRSTERFVRLWFEDNGIGIESGEMQRLFQMFHRGHAHGEYEGTGMGLAIVRKATERMGGHVGVTSYPGQGSRFWVELKIP